MVARLSRPDAAELLVPPRPVGDAAELTQKATRLRAALTALGDLVESGDMAPTEYRSRLSRLLKQLAGVEAKVTEVAGTSPLAPIAGRADADAVWEAMNLAERRAVIATLMDVVVRPSPTRGQRFDLRRAQLTWRTEAGS